MERKHDTRRDGRLLSSWLLVLLLSALTVACGGGPGAENGITPQPENGIEEGANGEEADGGEEADAEEDGAEPAVFVRKNVNDLTAEELASLRRGIQVMKDREVSDPTSWIYQANIHGTTQLPLEEAWQTCQHGSFFFLSWHRMYLYYFERILRAASGDPDLTLPYWDYTTGTTEDRRLPLPFREPAEASNSLWIPQRSPVMNGGGTLTSSAVQTGPAFALTDFCSPEGSSNSFGGQQFPNPIHGGSPHSVFEMTPHDAVHVQVGGFMGSFATAARDPIFWLHHANIDRLWNRWQDQEDGRGHPDVAVWLDHEFTFFNENGDPKTKKGSEILDTVADLNYRYDDSPGTQPANPATPCEEIREEVEPVTLAERAGVTLGGGAQTVDLQEQIVEEAEIEGKGLKLDVEGIEFDQSPGAIYEIYLNLPEGAEPTHESPHYVGNLVFFGLEHKDGAEPRLSYPVTKLVDRLRAEGEWTEGDFDVTFVRRPPEPPEGMVMEEAEPVPVKIGKISISTQ